MQAVSGMPNRVAEPKKAPVWLRYLILVLVLGLLGWGAYSLFTRGSDENPENVKVVDLSGDEDSATTEETPDEEVATDDTEPEAETTTADLSSFSENEQSVGESINESEYSLNSIEDSEQSGFHRIVFEIEGSEGTTEEPYVVATYKSSVGAIRMDLNGMVADTSGIGYQKSRTIDKDGVIRIYHNVSADQTEELYDIGVASSTPFQLKIEEVSAGLWNVTLDVEYPGSSDVESNFGSTEFSKEDQSIDGAVSVDGAKVTAYTYSTSGNVLSIVWTVSGSSAKPIPSATAGYDGGILTLRFTDITTDVVAKMPAALTLPNGIMMVWEMEDANTSIYTFDNTANSFKLSGTTNPNQVVLEIQL